MVMEHRWDHNYNISEASMTKAKLYSVSSPAQATEKKQMQRVIIIHGMNKRLMRTWKDVELHVARIVNRAPSSSSCLYPRLVEERSREETRSRFSTTREPLRGLAPSWTPSAIEPLFNSSIPLLQIRFCASNNTKFYIIICIQSKINGWNYGFTIVLRGSITVIHANKQDH